MSDQQEEITDEFTLRRIKKMVDDLCIDLDGDIHQQLAEKFVSHATEGDKE